MDRKLDKLSSTEFDLLVVGGGIFGACSAWHAAQRGLSVALIDREDFGGGASANSYKMVHGGIRYLQHADLNRLRASCRERSTLLKIAPHLVHPLPILVPTYGHLKQGKPYLGAGMLVYDLLTLDRNRGIRDPMRRIPHSRFLSRAEVLKLFPDLNADGLTGGAVFCDGQMHNPTRLLLAFVQSAASSGATVANYVEAVQLLRDSNSVLGVRAKDALTGSEFDIRARVTLNAAGPWAENLLNSGSQKIDVQPGTYSRDACFVVRRKFNNPYALAIQGRTSDPDALMGREARHLFIVPWREFSLIGVWHVVYKRGPDDISVGESELQSFIDEINWAYPALSLQLNDVLMCNAGLVPFGENEPGAVNLSYGKESRIIDHAQTQGIDGLVTLIGIRYTMGRADAEKAVDIACKKLGNAGKRAMTHPTSIHGGDFDNFDKLLEQIMNSATCSLPRNVAESLAHNHGSEYTKVIHFIDAEAELASTLGGSTVLRAEIVNAIENEMAMTLDDIVFRRTDLATGQHPGKAALTDCAQVAQERFGWSASRYDEELKRVELRLSNRGMTIRQKMDCGQ